MLLLLCYWEYPGFSEQPYWFEPKIRLVRFFFLCCPIVLLSYATPKRSVSVHTGKRLQPLSTRCKYLTQQGNRTTILSEHTLSVLHTSKVLRVQSQQHAALSPSKILHGGESFWPGGPWLAEFLLKVLPPSWLWHWKVNIKTWIKSPFSL